MYNALYPEFITWSKDYHVPVESFILRNMDWVELGVLDPESDAISSEFYKPNGRKKGNPIEFKASTISLMLELPPAIHSTITTHIDDTLEQEGLAKSEEKTVSEAV